MAFTYFFRDLQTLEIVREHVAPAMRTRRYFHIWDAGCAHGPEPYSLAIIIRESMGAMIYRNIHIHATDIDISDRFGKAIIKGVYPTEQVKRIPKEVLEKYFRPSLERGHFELVDEIRERVSFQRHDLLRLEPIRKNIGLVVCKNVLLHFTEKERVDVIKMFHAALEEEGFLVMEQTQVLPVEVADLFRRVVSHAQLFRKR